MRRILVCLGLLLATSVGATPRSLVVVTPRSPWTLREIEALDLDLVSYDPDTGAIYLTVTPDEERMLVERGYAVATVLPQADAGRLELLNQPNLGLYHTYAETVAELESLQTAHPTLARLEILGVSLEGRAIPALKISDTPEVEDPTEADVLFVGNHHAREFMSVEVPLFVARTLLERYAQSARIRALVDTREIWIVPILNPDGHVYQSETQMRPGWRKNRRSIDGDPIGVDLNRNYSYLWGYDEEGSSGEPLSETYRGASPFSEPETDALRRLVERQEFSVGVSYHSFGRLVLFPWGHTRDTVTPDHAVFVAMADSMVRDNGYRPGNASTGAIYLTNGVWDDYMYGETTAAKPKRTFAFTVELNDVGEGGFWPPEDVIEPTCDAMWSLNLFVLRVADDVQSTIPPAPPLLTAVQDAENPRQIHMVWAGPGRGAASVDHYEVFEVSVVQGAVGVVTAQAARLEGADRAVLAYGVRVPADGTLPFEVRGRLDPLWDRLTVEARSAGDNDWQTLAPLGTSTRLGAGSMPRLAGSVPRRLRFGSAAWAGRPVDVAVRLDPSEGQTSWVEAKLDIADLLAETRRVLAVVHDTTYTVVAERAGLFAYGVTAVAADGRGADSDIFWFVIPESTPVAIADVRFECGAGQAVVRFRYGATTAATFEAWVRPLSAGETPRSAAIEWSRGGYRRAAVIEAAAPGDVALHVPLPAGRSAVLLRSADGGGTWGAWEAGARPRLALHGAVPNPFNPQTRLRFETDAATLVTVQIVRPDGKRVRRLVSASLGAGVHETIWDGRDDSGRRVAAGVYVATLRAHGETRALRLVLLP